MNYVKSPLNYVGGKYKLLPHILPKFPNNINSFIDLFGGGFNVGINVNNANQIVYNELNFKVVELIETLSKIPIEKSLNEIDNLINTYHLSKTNEDGYYKLRKYYNNENKSPLVFYTLICHSFNYQIRFNSNGEFNMPFGSNRSSFNTSLRNKFITFVETLQSKNIIFTNNSFIELNPLKLQQNDFVYCDPPYFNSTASYNEQNGWTEQNERDLLRMLDKLNELGIKFALSNNLKYENPILDNWKDKYIVHYIDANYSNCNYQKKDKSKDVEVLITNY